MLSTKRHFLLRRNFILQHCSAQSYRIMTSGFFITNKILSRDVHLHIFLDENILLLVLHLSMLKESFCEQLLLW